MKNFIAILATLFSGITQSSCVDKDLGPLRTDFQEVEEIQYDWGVTADSMQASTYSLYISADGSFNFNPGGSFGGYWPNAHALHVYVDAYNRTGDGIYPDRMKKLLQGIKSNNGNTYTNVFNDDMLWLGNSCVRAYEATGDEEYLEVAEYLWHDVLESYSEVFGGGITWKKDTPNLKNAVSNGPTVVLATRLYNVTGDEYYLDWAKELYAWQKEHLVDPETGLVWDNIELIEGVPTVKKDWIFTYNAGTWIGSGLRLFRITGENGYLLDAIQTAKSSMTRAEISTEGILKDEGQGDGGLFKGIFIRYFTELIQEPSLSDTDRKTMVDYLSFNAGTFYKSGMKRPEMLAGPNWRELPGGQVDLTTQLSGLMLMESAALLQKEGILE
ncbi:putative alpha-1,6-mannanase (GH76 family) [Algoriphagus sp. 4150]|uniref:glycoside hydrolase family 76 protein n=1 Tax=Algoriphagus sp. 4150 TaxID=2817756 RepID=UPI002865F7A3|nr:glycoside hydrolase family 76 protein [Algoriphagus sp. 4150]MDR7130293.1 putative alpha-1,6-mannanase (GH76 family) [Algoriphagus sp. 4150]